MSADGNCRRQPRRMKRNERTPPSSVCPYALTSEDLRARMISGWEERRIVAWPSRFTTRRAAYCNLDRRRLNGVRERGPVGGTLSSVYLSPTDPVSIWPLRWVTNTLNWYSEQSELQPTVSCRCTPWCLSDNIINICHCVCYKTNKDLERGSGRLWNVAWPLRVITYSTVNTFRDVYCIYPKVIFSVNKVTVLIFNVKTSGPAILSPPLSLHHVVKTNHLSTIIKLIVTFYVLAH